MSRLRPTLEHRHADALVTHVATGGEDADWFRGHFPGAPILPGVATLAAVEESIVRFWQDPGHPALDVVGLHRVRFRQVVGPGAGLRIRVWQTHSDRLRFSVENAGAPVADGECITRPCTPAAGQVRPAQCLTLPAERHTEAFCSDGTSVGAVADLASRLCSLGSVSQPADLCVASADRVEVAAAVLAALSGQVQARFPPAHSAEALRAAHQAHAFSHWLGPPAWAAASADQGLGPPVAAEALPCAPLTTPAAADRPCIVLHTGGSTGGARSWAKTGRSLLQEAALHAGGLQLSPEDHILATVPPYHIYGLLFSVVLPLCSGATVERFAPFFPQEIADRIVGTGATILVSTPVHLKALATVLDGPHRLRLVLSSGAPLAAADARALAARTGLWPLEVYGSTETGGIALRRQDGSATAWHPLPGVSCRAASAPSGLGPSGGRDGVRLAVRSPFLSEGLPLDPEGFFATADLASLHPDGSFELAGRADGVVKVGAQRVFLPDIERAILALGQVTDAAVLALPCDSGRGLDILALVVSPRPADDILRELRDVLPPAFWPRRLRTVEAIPTTPAGKRDREAMVGLLVTPPTDSRS